tara:strand:- start:143 stop:592 length:450 start_codon:yes stop_codon:yes gene_type:complete
MTKAKETTQIEAAIEASTNTITYLVSVLGEELVSAAQKLGEMQDLDSVLYNNSTAIKALQSAQTCKEPAVVDFQALKLGAYQTSGWTHTEKGPLLESELFKIGWDACIDSLHGRDHLSPAPRNEHIEQTPQQRKKALEDKFDADMAVQE